MRHTDELEIARFNLATAEHLRSILPADAPARERIIADRRVDRLAARVAELEGKR